METISQVIEATISSTVESEPSSENVQHKRPQFGTRYLTNPQSVFKHNAWDNVTWDDTMELEAKNKVHDNSSTVLDQELRDKYEREACDFWDEFYGIHQNKFFKDRHWLFTEFPELAPQNVSLEHQFNEVSNETVPSESSDKSYPGSQASVRVLEIGCGVGNTVFPILETNNDTGTFVYCCDFSKAAVKIVTENPLYDPARCYVFVSDISNDKWDTPFPEGSLDIIIMIFVLSAIEPNKMQHVANLVSKYLKPGGLILFRDYGRYDMAQLRFKPGHCLSENFYVRGDGTRVYFFTQDEVKSLFVKAGLREEQLLIDRRLQVNRGKQLKMYRVWIQCKFRKPLE